MSLNFLHFGGLTVLSQYSVSLRQAQGSPGGGAARVPTLKRRRPWGLASVRARNRIRDERRRIAEDLILGFYFYGKC